MKNIEIKARTDRANQIRSILMEQNADSRGIDHQIDTYFRIPEGRMKLRQGDIENCLVYYERPNQAGPKRSDVFLAFPEDTDGVRDVLSKALGVLCVVRKHREILFIGNTKFHLDEVDELGSFVEIEVIDHDDGLPVNELEATCQRYMTALGIRTGDLITDSYSDMLLSQSDRNETTSGK